MHAGIFRLQQQQQQSFGSRSLVRRARAPCVLSGIYFVNKNFPRAVCLVFIFCVSIIVVAVEAEAWWWYCVA